MFWNQTQSRRMGFHAIADRFQPASRDSSDGSTLERRQSHVHGMKVEKVEPLVARFLGLEPMAMARHFYPATEENLEEIIRIRQEFVAQPPDQDEAYLRWRYSFSPTGSDLDMDRNRIWIFTKDNVILGMVGVEAAKLRVRGTETKAIKVMDLAVKPEIDRKGLGVWMNLRLQSMGRPIIALGSNRNSLGIMSKLYRRMPDHPVYKNILHSSHYFSAKVNNSIVAGMLSSVYDASFPLLLGTRSLASGKTIELEKIERFSSEDSQAVDAMQSAGTAFIRDVEYLNWRLFDAPHDNIEVLGLRENGDLVGYLALAFRCCDPRKCKATRAFLLDWGCLPQMRCRRALAAALVQCQRKLRKEGVESISAFAYDGLSGKLLRRAGLHRREDDTKTVSIYAGDVSTLAALQQADEWFLTGADTDYA